MQKNYKLNKDFENISWQYQDATHFYKKELENARSELENKDKKIEPLL
jgi:hypothetical protein